jgi:prevent-host-death family protein
LCPEVAESDQNRYFDHNSDEERLMERTTRVTASEFQNAFGQLSDKARAGAVVITKHGRDSLVMIPVEEWERLKRRDRQVGLTADLSDEWLEAIRSARLPSESRATAEPK